jgi:hypothetical protein
MISAMPKVDDPPFEPQSLQAILREIEDLARREMTAELLEELRKVADAAQRFATDGKNWALGIAEWPNRLGGADTAEISIQRQAVVCHLLEIERTQERGLYPLLWQLEDRRHEVEQYSPEVRAAWLGHLDAMISGIREPLDIIRATRIALQEAECTGLGQHAADNSAIDQRAVIGYKKIADEVFHAECAIRTEIVGGERFYIIEIPVADMGISYRNEEDRIHSVIENVAPQYVGRVAFRYVPRRGAA